MQSHKKKETTAPLGLLEGLAQSGYKANFFFKEGRVFDADSGEYYAQDDLAIDGIFRFEGPSDPENMSIVYALSTGSGRKGVVTDAFGMYGDENLSHFMEAVEDRRESSTIFDSYPMARSYAIPSRAKGLQRGRPSDRPDSQG